MEQHEKQPTMPVGMVEVTSEQFYAAIDADAKRDPMPTSEKYETLWLTRRTPRPILVGWNSTGWKSAHGTKKVYAIYPNSLLEQGEK